MNKTRRKEISKIVEVLQDATARLEFLEEAEQEACDNIPENLQTSQNRTTVEEAVEALQDAICSIAEAIEGIEDL
jgi:t-SNARE complex subunit (syntaxin)